MNYRQLVYKNRFILLVIFLVLVAHSTYIVNEFTWLDHGDIVTGRSVVSVFNFREIFFNSFGQTSFYRPLVTLLNSIDYALYGINAFGFHLTNVLLHTATVFVVYLFTKKYFKLEKKTALAASFIFGIHPISWLPVGAISYRPELIVTVFTLIAIYFHINTRLTKNKYGILTYIFLILALFSKETSVFWIPLLIYAWEVKKEGRFHIQIKTIHKIEFLIVAAYFAFRLVVVPIEWLNSESVLNLSFSIGTRLSVIGKQLLFLVSPLKPALSDATSITNIISISSLATLLILTFSILLVGRLKNRNKYSQSLVFIFIALLPALNIVPLPRFNSPHYAYFASIGIAVIMAVTYFKQKDILGKILKISIILWIAISTFSTFVSGFRFKDDLTLFLPEVTNDANFLEGHFYIADYYFKSGDYVNAEIHYELAREENAGIIAYVDRYASTLNLAGVKLALGKTQEAEKLLLELKKTIKGGDNGNIIYNLGLVYFNQKEYEKTIEVLNTYKNWTRVEPLLLLSKSYLALNMTEEALESLKYSLKFLNDEQAENIKALIEEINREDSSN